MKRYCFYHSGDFDGKCSGAIVKLKYPDVILYGINYDEDFPWNIIKQGDIVYMVDFSLPKDDMIKLDSMCDFTWIDHHINAIQEMKKLITYNFLNDEYAACQLTWMYLFHDRPVPKVVNLLGNYDIWNHEDPDVLPFQMGLKLYNLDPHSDFKQWQKLFTSSFIFPYYKRFIKIGKNILKYQETKNKQMIKNAYEVEFEGYKTIALNTMGSNSFVFNSLDDVYDIKILYYNNGNKWIYTLYSDDESTINVGAIAKKYGGGGHFHAAGFNLNELLF